MSGDYTARARREAAELIAALTPNTPAYVPHTYETFVEIVAVAWMQGHEAALAELVGDDSA